MSNSKKVRPDMAPVVACLVTMLCIGIVYLWSVFQQPVIDHYGWDTDAVTMVSSAIIFFFVLGSLIGGAIQDRTSPRFVIILGAALLCLGLFTTSLLGAQHPSLIYLSYGVCAGLGVGFGYSGALNCIQKWFPHRRGFATGISACAFGLATVLLAPLIEWLIERFGVPGAFRALAFTFPVIVAAAGLFARNPSREYLDSLKLPESHSLQRQYSTGEAMRTPEFWAVALALFFQPAAYMMIIPRVKTLGLLRELSPALTTLTVSLTGVVSAASRLLCSTLSDKLGRAVTVWALCLVTLTASLLMIFARGGLYVAAVLLIVCGYSGPAGIFPAMCTDAFGTKNSGANYGMAFMFLGVSSVVFPYLSTLLSSGGAETGNYTRSFLVAAAVCLVPLTSLPLYDLARKKRRERDRSLALTRQPAQSAAGIGSKLVENGT